MHRRVWNGEALQADDLRSTSRSCSGQFAKMLKRGLHRPSAVAQVCKTGHAGQPIEKCIMAVKIVAFVIVKPGAKTGL